MASRGRYGGCVSHQTRSDLPLGRSVSRGQEQWETLAAPERGTGPAGKGAVRPGRGMPLGQRATGRREARSCGKRTLVWPLCTPMGVDVSCPVRTTSRQRGLGPGKRIGLVWVAADLGGGEAWASGRRALAVKGALGEGVMVCNDAVAGAQ